MRKSDVVNATKFWDASHPDEGCAQYSTSFDIFCEVGRDARDSCEAQSADSRRAHLVTGDGKKKNKIDGKCLDEKTHKKQKKLAFVCQPR